MIDFQVTTNFTDDVDGFIDGGDLDPDICSRKLQEYHQFLWSKELPNHSLLSLKIGNCNYDYLHWNGIRFGSDSIINTYWNSYKLSWLIEQVKQEISKTEDINKFRSKYLQESYTIGGSIIFPKHKCSINQCRGMYSKIKDRFDLTLECIRRYYNKETSPLVNVLISDANYFDLFIDFKGFVDFFYLQDLVSNDYKKINFFLPFDNFTRNPLPKNIEEWFKLHNAQIDFLRLRNKRIENSIQKRG